MTHSAPRLPAVLALAALVFSAAACGDAPEPQPQVPVRWSVSKPNPLVGRVQAAIVERPGPDRAWIEARYERRGAAPGCALEIMLAEGVVLLEGRARVDLAADDGGGSAAWLVEFPLGGSAEAVIRLCAETPGGMRSCETTLRLTGE